MFLLNLHSNIIIIIQQVGDMNIFLTLDKLKRAVGMKKLSIPDVEDLNTHRMC